MAVAMEAIGDLRVVEMSDFELYMFPRQSISNIVNSFSIHFKYLCELWPSKIAVVKSLSNPFDFTISKLGVTHIATASLSAFSNTVLIIIQNSPKIQMIWSDTSRIITRMANKIVSLNGAVMEFIRKPVRPMSFSFIPKFAVPFCRSSSNPYPTSRLTRFYSYFIPKSFHKTILPQLVIESQGVFCL
jgi:hypothetical protein